MRVLEGSFFMCVSCPVVCAMHAQWSVQHEDIIALREKSPHILRPAMHPTEVRAPQGCGSPQSAHICTGVLGRSWTRVRMVGENTTTGGWQCRTSRLQHR